MDARTALRLGTIGGAVDAEADGDAGVEHRGDVGEAGAQAGVRRRAVRDAGAGVAEPPLRVCGEVHGVGEPHVGVEPAGLVHVLDRVAAVDALAVVGLVQGLAQVRVEADALVAGECRGLAQQLGRDGERRAGGDGDPQHRAGGGVVVAVDRVHCGDERGVDVLDDVVGRQASLGDAAVHRPAGEVQAQADPGGGLDLDVDEVGGLARRVDVVVVGGGGAAGQGQPREPGGVGGGDVLGPDARPHRVEVDEPFEERVVGRATACGPLVEVVVGVHEAGSGEAAGAVDAADLLPGSGPVALRACLSRGRTGPDCGDQAVLDDDVAALMLGARAVNGRHPCVLDHKQTHHTRSGVKLSHPAATVGCRTETDGGEAIEKTRTAVPE
jgi:hypothetical protein